MSDILKLAEQLGGSKVEAPAVSDRIDPVTIKPRASDSLLSEMEERRGFDRSDPSMEYKGSKSNEDYVRRKIYEKYGLDEGDNYVPCVQVKPRTEWLKNGFLIKEGEEPLCFIPTKRKGMMVNVAVYHINQVVSDE